MWVSRPWAGRSPVSRTWARAAAPRHPPASLAAGWTNSSSNGPSPEDTAVGDTVERHSPRHAEIAAGDLGVEIGHLFQQDLFEHHLDAPGDVLMKREELRLGRPGGRPEEVDQPIRVHPVALQKVEVFEVQAVLAGLPLRHQRPHLVDVARLAVGREPHHLVLPVVDVEAQVGGNGAVEQAERAREVDLFEEVDHRAGGPAEGGRRPLAHAVHRQHRGLFEPRVEEAARGVGLVMVEDLQPAGVAEHAPDLPLGAVDPSRQAIQDFAADGLGGLRVERHPDLPGELLRGVFVVGDAVDVGEGDATRFETEPKGLPGEPRVVFDPREALLLRRRDQLAVAEEAAGGIVVVRRDPEDVHRHAVPSRFPVAESCTAAGVPMDPPKLAAESTTFRVLAQFDPTGGLLRALRASPGLGTKLSQDPIPPTVSSASPRGMPRPRGAPASGPSAPWGGRCGGGRRR